ncbi:protein of unknown function DUF985 [Chloroherpeton thalassium ATCC 35110]|uniref:DUF985 domain-containing protein n=1 Tax=Chloroherpeton thalassium (strain ATCC 35110 / GB-78) TaxID=517418 RepID=B3QT98_CHLT3|nr:cupin domain-containing protein [Chloroherpeton thalassium]ACF14197.1 protein of unknown function DUF985 [Chloroherpeton thalassium ATCC 35110]
MKPVEYWIEQLELEPHAEGGFFKEVYRSPDFVASDGLPNRYQTKRALSTSIYFLITDQEFSAFHRLQSDEVWHFYDGDALALHLLTNDGNLKTARLGKNIEAGESLQLVMPGLHWFAAEMTKPNSYALVGCTVSPGFEYSDFELAEKNELLKIYPQHTAIIQRLTRSRASSV